MTIHVSSFVVGILFVFAVLGLVTFGYAVVGMINYE
jgi:hypothetical protein